MSIPAPIVAQTGADIEAQREITDDKIATHDKQSNNATLDDSRYDRFSPRRKAIITIIVAYGGLLAPFATSAFLPSIPTIADALDTTQNDINYLGICAYLIVIGVAPLSWARLSRMHGRRPVYLASLPVMALGSVGVALSHSLTALVLSRVVQGIGASSVLSLGAASISDVYRPTERGNAMGLFLITALLGPCLSPIVAGVLQQYVKNDYGWRANQWLLSGMAVLATILVLIFLPETIWESESQKRKNQGKKFSLWKEICALNPVDSLRLLSSSCVLAISLNSAFVLAAFYVLLVPVTYTLAPRYNITNEAIIGCLFLPSGAGNIVGSKFVGRYSDTVIKKSIAKRGYFRPEDRLRASLAGCVVGLPISLLAAGLFIQFVGGAAGLVLSLLAYFSAGIGLMWILTVTNTYLVDTNQSRAAEVIAVNNALRYIMSAGASAAVLPMVQHIGVAAANGIASGFCLMGAVLVLSVWKYGDGWRTGKTGTLDA